MLKAIGISGSARKGGNSETLLRAVLEGAKEAGAQTQIVRLNEMTHSGCRGCDACVKTGRCALHDLDDVYETLREARVWIFASPIYYDCVNGQMKLFFNRLRPFSKSKLPEKRAGLVLVTYEDREREDYAKHARMLAGYLSWFGAFDPAETFCASRLAGKKDASARPDLIEQARAIGKRLAAAVA